MDFTFSDDQDAAAGRGAHASSPTRRRARTCGRWPTTSAASPTSVWATLAELGWTGPARPRGRRRPRARARRHGRRARGDGAAPVPRARSSRRRCSRRSPRRVSAPTSCSRRSRRARCAGTVALEESRSRRPGRPGRTRARRKGAHWVLNGAEAARARRPHRRLGDRRRPHRGRSRLVPARRPRDCEAVPDARPDAQGRRASCSTTRPVEPIGPLGDHTAIWRRVVDDAAVMLAAELVGACEAALAARRRVREGARAVRPADRVVPGDPAQDRRHAAPPRAGSGRDALRGVGVRRRRPGARARGGDGQGLRRRGRGVRHRRRTSRSTAASASPGTATRTSTTSAPSRTTRCSATRAGSAPRLADLVLAPA